ncbi:MAG: hypothetical protein HFE86_06600 [Clostridiales bacterium]|nr:hypothetical protein [Clostridiales bacterium]
MENRREPIRITCAGASIVQGCGATDERLYGWPGQLAGLLGEGYAVCNAGAGGAPAAKPEHGGEGSYWEREEYKQGMDFAPQIVTILLGGNDANQRQRITPEIFAADYAALIRSFQELPSRPQVVLIEQTACHNGDGRQEWVDRYANPIVRRLGAEMGLPVILLGQVTWEHPEWHSEDGLHFTDAGYGQLARIIYEALLPVLARRTEEE